MDWGTKRAVGNAAEAKAYVASLQTEWPPVASAYVPSGKLPPLAIVWLGLGAALGVPAGALTGLVLGGITMALLALVGFLLGLMASVCGRVLCVVVLLELAIAVIGAGATFVGVGAMPAWITAWAGKHGKNRNTWAAVVLSLPSALVAYALVVAVPQLAALAIGPADPSDDFAPSTLVHMLSDLSWTTAAVYGLGLIVTIAACAFAAHEAVGAQKFCEPCERYMDELPLHGLDFERARWAIDAIRRGGAGEIAPHLASASGADVESYVYACPGCQRGYFEAKVHVHAAWNDAKGNPDSRTENWLCTSIELPPDATRALAAVKKVEA